MTHVASAPVLRNVETRSSSLGSKALLWSMVYSTLGLDGELEDFLSLTPWVEVDTVDGRICAPVIKGLTLELLVQGFKDLGIEVRFPVPTVFSENSRDPEKGSYWVAIHDNNEADPDNQSKSVAELDARMVRGCTLIEYLLIKYSECVFRGHPIGEKGTVTLCGGSRRGTNVPAVSYNPAIKVIYVSLFSIHSYGPNFRLREVFTQF